MRQFLPFLALLALAAAAKAQTRPTRLTVDGDSVPIALAPGQTVTFTATLKKGALYALLGADAFSAAPTTVRDVYPFDTTITGPDGKPVDLVEYQNFFEPTRGIDPYVGASYFTAPATGTYTFLVLGHDDRTTMSLGISLRSAAGFSSFWNHANFASPTLTELWDKELARPGAIEDFYESRKGLGSLVEEYPGDEDSVYVTFLYKGDPTLRQVAFGGPSSLTPMQRFGTSDVYILTRRLPKNAYFTYWFSTDRKAQIAGDLPFYRTFTATPDYFEGADPLFADDQSFSTLILPKAVLAPETKSAPASGGKIVDATISSQILGEVRPYQVYLPTGYASLKSLPVVVVFDGNHSVGPNQGVPVSAVLDNLIAERRISPMAAVFVDNLIGARTRDLVSSTSFAGFVAQELLPEVRRNYRVTGAAARTIVAGFSYGGLQAAYTSLLYSGTFGNALCMLPSFWANPAVPEDLDLFGESLVEPLLLDPNTRTSGVHFFLGYGLYEPTIQLPTRHIRDMLRLSGVVVDWKEYPSNHAAINEGNELVDGLISLARGW